MTPRPSQEGVTSKPKMFVIFTCDELGKAFKAFVGWVAKKRRLDKAPALCFRFDGERLAETATPEGLGMDECDVIDADFA